MSRHAAVCLLMLASGCWRSHAPIDPGAASDASVPSHDAGTGDAGRETPRDASTDAPRDGSTDAQLDAAIVDDAGICEATVEPVLRVCSYAPTGALPEGEPADLTLTFQACTCAGRHCAVRVDDDTIDVTTSSCPDLAGCGECENDLACPIPPLEAGDYALRVDGRIVAWSVPVRPRATVTSARPICWAIQQPVTSAITCGDAHVEPVAETHCHRDLEDVGTAVHIDVRYRGSACAPPAECSTQLDGLTLRLAWSRLECAGGDVCAGDPMLHTIRCVTPPLRAATYRVVGETGPGFESSLEVRDVSSVPETRCFP